MYGIFFDVFFLKNALFGLVSYNDPCYLSCKCIGDEVLPGPELWWSWVYGCRPFCADQRTAEGDLGTKPMLGRLSTSRWGISHHERIGGARGVPSNAAFGVYYLDVHGSYTDRKLVRQLVVHFTYLTNVSNLYLYRGYSPLTKYHGHPSRWW